MYRACEQETEGLPLEYIFEQIGIWLKDVFVGGIENNISGMFDSVNAGVGRISARMAETPESFNPGIFTMLKMISDNVILPLAGIILAFVMTLELIRMVMEKNNMRDMDFLEFFKWIFKTACAVILVSNTWNIVSGIFELSGSIVRSTAGLIRGSAAITLFESRESLHAALMAKEVPELLGIWLQTSVAGIAMWALSICIFLISYGRMIEIYLLTSVSPIPMAAVMADKRNIGGGYLRSLAALGLQGFLIIVCVAIYSALVQGIVLSSDISGAVWTCMGYSVLLCFCLFKTGTLAKNIMGTY